MSRKVSCRYYGNLRAGQETCKKSGTAVRISSGASCTNCPNNNYDNEESGSSFEVYEKYEEDRCDCECNNNNDCNNNDDCCCDD